ncbi:MAG: hydantoinase B/oxoprolinase family protein [Burkholderiaceae bacterium]|jgi:N-methylhydantoinase B|nr:hydantoinase B/oxoprolinase family protein [Burkholderiaceae bacterium]
MSGLRLRDLDDAAFRARYACGRFDATVLTNRFGYILEHFCSKLLACSFSPVLREFYDFAATISGPAEAGWPTPAVSRSFMMFTGTMTESVRNTVVEYGVERLGPGDVIIGNDPYRTGTHVNDLLFIRPVFHDGVLCGFVNLKAHQLDMGGSVPGGFSTTKTSIYENGLVMSPRALMRGGKPVDETWTLIFDNVRFGMLLRRDMQTIIACLDLGERQLLESVVRYGRDAVLGAMRYACDADAERMADALASLPDGDWTGEALLDCDGIDDREEYPVRCTIKKRGARIEVDTSGTARQARTSINGTYLDTKTMVGVALKFLLDPDGPFTSGCYRPVDIVIPDGAILSALPPEGVVFAYGESTNVLMTAIFAALAGPLGARAVAGDTGAPNLHSAQGMRSDGGPWVSIGVAGGENGPWGATSDGDGDSFALFMAANTLAQSIEAAEAETPLAILRQEYVVDSAGPGRHRGGASVQKDSLWLEPATHHLFTLRFKRPSGIGVYGGRDGISGGVWLWPGRGAEALAPPQDKDWCRATPVSGRIDPETLRLDPRAPWAWLGRNKAWQTAAGAAFRYVTNGGGGWGDPMTRDPRVVLRDVADGYVSIEGAARDYGVVVAGDPQLDPEGLRLDEAATQRLRTAARS